MPNIIQLPDNVHPNFQNPRTNPPANGSKVVTNGIGRNLEAALLPIGNTWIDLVSGEKGIPINAPANSVGLRGRKIDYDLTSSQYTQFTNFKSPFADICNGDITIAMLVQTTSTAGWLGGFAASSDSTPCVSIQGDPKARTLTRSAGGNDFAVQFSSGPDIDDGLPHLIVLQKHGNNTVDVYTDGIFGGTASPTTPFDNWNIVDQFSLGNFWRTTPGSYWTGSIYGAAIWSRKIAPSEILSLSINFWQIYQPVIPPILPAVAGAELVAIASITAVGFKEGEGTATVPAVATITAVGDKAGEGTSTTSAIATITAVGEKAGEGTATVPAIATITAVGGKEVDDTATLPAIATINAVGGKVADGATSLSSIASITAAGEKAGEGTATLPAIATITAVGEKEASGTTSLPAIATITAVGEKAAQGTAQLSAIATITAVGEKGSVGERDGTSQISAIASITAVGEKSGEGDANLTAIATINPVGQKEAFGTSLVSAIASITAVGTSGVIIDLDTELTVIESATNKFVIVSNVTGDIEIISATNKFIIEKTG